MKKDSQSLAADAVRHTKEMQENFAPDIASSVERSRIFRRGTIGEISKNTKQGLDTQLLKMDTVTALFSLPVDSHVCLLNFASFRYSGGQFLSGSMAQEEALCHESFLYNVLEEQTEYYAWTNQNTNHGLYQDSAIFSPDILFFRDDREHYADVVTCAAPNRSCLFDRKPRFTEAENSVALQSRIHFLSDVFCRKGYEPEYIIIGAFGCGVFAQDAGQVASIFRTSRYPASAKIIYAVPDSRNYVPSFRVFHPYP